jgi:hypothetical protein
MVFSAEVGQIVGRNAPEALRFTGSNRRPPAQIFHETNGSTEESPLFPCKFVGAFAAACI